jgi:type VI secretion system protein ImpA
MPAASYEIEPLLTPLSDEEPCGPDLEYDPEFQALERAGAGTPERQYGDKVFPAEPPDWPQVHELALGLAARSRDLRVAVWLARSGARLHGLPGAWRGLQLLQGLLEQRWDLAHPQLDATDNNDPTMRLNALTPLAAPEALLADLRAAGIVARRGSLTLRELELGLGRDDPHGDETSPTEAGVLQGLAGLCAEQPEATEALQGCADAAAAIVAAVESQVGSAAPDLSAFTRLADTGPLALARMAPDAGGDAGDEAAGAEPGGGGGGGFAVGGGGSIRSRADAVRELERVCEWLERNEPSHPAPLLIRRAQRLMNMTFIEIIQDMAPGGIDQVQTIAGPQPEQSSD